MGKIKTAKKIGLSAKKALTITALAVGFLTLADAQAQNVIRERILDRTEHTYVIQVNEPDFVRVVSRSYAPETAFSSTIRPGCDFWTGRPVGSTVKLVEVKIQYENGAISARLDGINRGDICGRFYFSRTQPFDGG